MRSTPKRLFILPVLFLFWSSINAQDPSSTKPNLPAPLTGKYEGVGKGPNGDVQMTLDLVNEAGKFSGRVTTANGAYEIIKGQVIDSLLTLELQDKDSVAKLSLENCSLTDAQVPLISRGFRRMKSPASGTPRPTRRVSRFLSL